MIFLKSRNKRDSFVKKEGAGHKNNGSECVRHAHGGTYKRYFHLKRRLKYLFLKTEAS
jgi:hypothetical protein